jgi:ATP-binding cassette, subfamily F, member 3
MDRWNNLWVVLATALDAQGDPTKPVKAYRLLSHERLETKLHQSQQVALRRSGARGKDARKALILVEEELAASDERLKEDLSNIDTTVLSKETQAAADMLVEVQSQLEMMDSAAAESRARTVLLGLGFSAEKIDNSMSKLSGGWRTRCDLACALCQQTDILLLDEPTNFLDLPSIIWLQGYINNLESTTVVVVTHDRDFADAVAEELLIMRDQKIERFRGNLSTYESEKIKKIKWMTTMQDAQNRQKKHMEQSIMNNIRAAKKTGDDKKLKQAASRQKRVDDRLGMQVNAKGHKFKLNRDLGGYHLTSRAAIDIPDFGPPVRIKFPNLPPDLRFPGALVSLEKVCYAYSKKSPQILNEITLTIHEGERVGVVGLNGSGKTTLVNLIAASASPTSGIITKHTRAKVARFSQHVVEELDTVAASDNTLTSLKHLMDVADGALDEKNARAVLGDLGLQGRTASDIPIAALSGGQKVRLAFAKLVWSTPHLLILDEVTTHLDADTILALVYAVREYEGAVLLITHDRFFMRCVIEGESPSSVSNRAGLEDDDEESDDGDEDDGGKKGIVYRMFKGQLRLLENGMRQYEEIATRASQRLTSKN